MAYKHTFPPKIREMWGFNDALLHSTWPGYVAEWHRGPCDRHYDKAYVTGYYAGMAAAKETK